MFAVFITYIMAFAGLTAWVSALPLNINLGAYSPALVVGDGEISFGGKADVNSLMTALEGAAVNTATTVAAQNSNANKPETEASAPVVVPANQENKDKDQANDISGILGGQTKEIEPRLEAVAPEDEEDEEDDVADETDAPVAKRDIAGFDRALRYAEAALVKGPKVQLGTGAEGSGVGIIVDNNQEAARRPGRGVEGGEAAPPVAPAPGGQAPPAGAPAEKRSTETPRRQVQRRAKVTTMYVRSGIPGGTVASSGSNLVARDILPQILTKRDNSNSGFDSVNLNVPADGVTMTFVETDDDDAE